MSDTPLQDKRRLLIFAGIAVLIVVAFTGLPAGRNLAAQFFRSLRVQRVQAVNLNLTPFTDPNANPTLHDMITKMISDKVVVTAKPESHQVPDAAAASQMAGFDVHLLGERKDSPRLIVVSRSETSLTVDRARLQAIIQEAGHPGLNLPPALDGATVSVSIPPYVRAQYGNCPVAGNAVADNLTGPPPASTQYSDCIRFSEGASPVVSVPQGLNVEPLAEIGLEVGGMTPSQARDFLQNVNWQSTLVMAVPRFVRSYEAVKVDGSRGTLLTMSGRRGPGYTLVWAKDGMAYSLEGYGDSSHAVELAESLK